MEVFHIAESDYEPGILFDPNNGLLKIWGKATPEDAFAFYKPAIEWLEKYLQTKPTRIKLQFRLSYYNTATSKIIIKILQMLEAYKKQSNAEIMVVWLYQPDDEEIMIAGEDFSEIVDLPFVLKPAD